MINEMGYDVALSKFPANIDYIQFNVGKKYDSLIHPQTIDFMAGRKENVFWLHGTSSTGKSVGMQLMYAEHVGIEESRRASFFNAALNEK
jgi:hypothetical protein